jgi:hypothetical protein
MAAAAAAVAVPPPPPPVFTLRGPVSPRDGVETALKANVLGHIAAWSLDDLITAYTNVLWEKGHLACQVQQLGILLAQAQIEKPLPQIPKPLGDLANEGQVTKKRGLGGDPKKRKNDDQNYRRWCSGSCNAYGGSTVRPFCSLKDPEHVRFMAKNFLNSTLHFGVQQRKKLIMDFFTSAWGGCLAMDFAFGVQCRLQVSPRQIVKFEKAPYNELLEIKAIEDYYQRYKEKKLTREEMVDIYFHLMEGRKQGGDADRSDTDSPSPESSSAAGTRPESSGGGGGVMAWAVMVYLFLFGGGAVFAPRVEATNPPSERSQSRDHES